MKRTFSLDAMHFLSFPFFSPKLKYVLKQTLNCICSTTRSIAIRTNARMHVERSTHGSMDIIYKD